MATFWKVFIAVLAIAIVVSLVTLFNGSKPVGSENLVGHPLPDFAAPLATSSLDGDSNIFTPQAAKAAHSTAACDVKLAGSVNSCSALAGDAVLLFWNSTKSECVNQVSTLNAWAKRHPKVNTLALSFDDKKAETAAVVRDNGWKIPVAVDRDGAVAALYAVAGCPSTFFARDGEVTAVKLGVLSPDRLDAGLAAGATD